LEPTSSAPGALGFAEAWQGRDEPPTHRRPPTRQRLNNSARKVPKPQLLVWSREVERYKTLKTKALWKTTLVWS
jgi:hypothetical protein